MDLGSDVEAKPHHSIGRTWVDVVLGVSAVAISLISLMLAIGNAREMKQLVTANSWPFVSLSVSNRDERGDKLLRLIAQNKGIGPAQIQTLEVFYNGKAIANPRALIEAILGLGDDARIPFDASSFTGEVLSSRETVTVLAVHDKSIPLADLEKLSDETRNIGFRSCYCSVFDECWVSDRTEGTSPPNPVKSCPIPKTPFVF